jgi:hypothetical protein
VDEKSQTQALDRTQPGLPLKCGCGATMTRDYKRHGTATLCAAALDAANGEIFGPLPRAASTRLMFLSLIDQIIPAEAPLDLR